MYSRRLSDTPLCGRGGRAPNIYIMVADVGYVRRLTYIPCCWETAGAWSPDGTRLLFSRNRDGYDVVLGDTHYRQGIDIYGMDADGACIAARLPISAVGMDSSTRIAVVASRYLGLCSERKLTVDSCAQTKMFGNRAALAPQDANVN